MLKTTPIESGRLRCVSLRPSCFLLPVAGRRRESCVDHDKGMNDLLACWLFRPQSARQGPLKRFITTWRDAEESTIWGMGFIRIVVMSWLKWQFCMLGTQPRNQVSRWHSSGSHARGGSGARSRRLSPDLKCSRAVPRRAAPRRATPRRVSSRLVSSHLVSSCLLSSRLVFSHLVSSGRARHGTARHGTARHGTARHGMARSGPVRSGPVRSAGLPAWLVCSSMGDWRWATCPASPVCSMRSERSTLWNLRPPHHYLIALASCITAMPPACLTADWSHFTIMKFSYCMDDIGFVCASYVMLSDSHRVIIVMPKHIGCMSLCLCKGARRVDGACFVPTCFSPHAVVWVKHRREAAANILHLRGGREEAPWRS